MFNPSNERIGVPDARFANTSALMRDGIVEVDEEAYCTLPPEMKRSPAPMESCDDGVEVPMPRRFVVVSSARKFPELMALVPE